MSGAPHDDANHAGAPHDGARNDGENHDGANLAGATLIAELERSFREYKQLAEGALAQLEDDDWHATLDAEANSIAVLVRHVAGNLTSRWTDFLTSDGEKPTRDRDGEFTATRLAAPALLAEWNAGFGAVFATLAALAPADLARTVTIRGEPHTAVGAMLRSLAHTAQHVGQIVLLAKHRRGERWRTLSIPKRR